jgi:hypothetical protein
MATTRGRLVQINQVVVDQADYFRSDGYTRVTGLTIGDLIRQLFYNNIEQPWPMFDGSSVPDSQVASGRIYFHEVPGSPGIYSVRFRPNAVGYWRFLLAYPVGQQILAQDYDVTPVVTTVSSGIKSSFVKPCT